MQSFMFHNPTRIEFGAGAADKVGPVCAGLGRTALLLAGQGSARRSGLLERVRTSLEAAGLRVVLHEGVRPNPVLSHVQAGIALARAEGVDLVVAVGGGSVLDSAKAVAAGACAGHDVWDFFCGQAQVEAALPLVAVLTLAATGSEMNGGGVVTREETREKLPFSSPHCFPRVSLLDPALTLDVSADQTANGLADAFAHLLEPYLSGTDPRPVVQLELKEALFHCLLDSGARLRRDLRDLEARADMMWTATLALNGITSVGIGPTLWPLHLIEHSVSALTDIAHGAGLSALTPGWLRWRLEQVDAETIQSRVTRLGERVFGLASGGPAETIVALETWYRSVGAPASLAEAGVDPALFADIAANAARTARAWGMAQYSEPALGEILRRAAGA